MSLQAALLRGVNLGKRKVVMSELRALIEAAGFSDVRTLLASGNVVLNAKEKAAKLEAKLEKLFAEGLGFKTDVYVRDHGELAKVIDANPFTAFAKAQPSFMVAFFMRENPSAALVKALNAQAGPEEIAAGPRCLYIKFSNGQGPSKLKLPTSGTARNWNTVGKLAAMLADE
ncbi:hypothetical protein U91I_03348 [alpha proteobacterium U9-1i]|nr:hypothetical protein U91I_03348 [alpha proteobacterium U9-1i]